MNEETVNVYQKRIIARSEESFAEINWVVSFVLVFFQCFIKRTTATGNAVSFVISYESIVYDKMFGESRFTNNQDFLDLQPLFYYYMYIG